ncbi:hypothetical protein Pla175_41440 [Pirellulimonas nuda]|uniref:DUF1579 domain-containing protein n=1 Tax=Pirellulimonas nuda TaxID=2528009 RepID=A0A518DGX7_9BACT|nr:DUF1579 domain-containing protein [Pirellulimonas nuda]QDU90733.1 hypothetical protein Pla175_41440 [Pirellulimonas nuda]
MFAKPQQEHAWLDRLVGEWTTSASCQMPDGSSHRSEGRLTCRSLGGLWLIADGAGEDPESGAWSTQMTLGYDPVVGKYVGTFVGSMMTHMFVYSGAVDASGAKLVLDTQGPGFDGVCVATYQDVVEFVGDDHWLLWSQMRGDDGQWNRFMEGHHRRIK